MSIGDVCRRVFDAEAKNDAAGGKRNGRASQTIDVDQQWLSTTTSKSIQTVTERSDFVLMVFIIR